MNENGHKHYYCYTIIIVERIHILVYQKLIKNFDTVVENHCLNIYAITNLAICNVTSLIHFKRLFCVNDTY